MAGHSTLSIKIKIPKLVVKTMHVKFQLSRSPRNTSRSQFSKKVRNKRSLGKKNEAEEFGKEVNNLVHENEAIVGPLSQLLKLEVEEIWGPEEGKHNRKDKRHLALTSSVDQNKKGRRNDIFNFKRSCGSEASEESTTKDVVASWRRLVRIKLRSWRLVRIVSKLMSITRSMTRKVRKRFGDESNREKDDEQVCLCNKRILMGERCKPLHSSGTLQYDSDGLLIPDLNS